MKNDRTDNQVKNRFNSTLRRVFASHRREAKAASTSGVSRKRKGGAPKNAGRESKRRARRAVDADTDGSEGSNKLAKRCSGAGRPASSADTGEFHVPHSHALNFGNGGAQDEDDDGSDSDDDETSTGLEQLVQASLEVERMERRHRNAGGKDAGRKAHGYDKGTKSAAHEQGESSVHGAKAFVEHAQMFANIQLQQHLAQMAAAQQGGAMEGVNFAGVSVPVLPAHLQRYPSFHSGPTTATTAAKVTLGEETAPAPADSPTSSGGNFTAPWAAAAGGTINPLALQMLILQQQQQQNVKPILQQLMNQMSRDMPLLWGVGEAKSVGNAGEGSEGSGLSVAEPMMGVAAMPHHWYPQLLDMAAGAPHGLFAAMGTDVMRALQQQVHAQAAASAAAGGGNNMDVNAA